MRNSWGCALCEGPHVRWETSRLRAGPAAGQRGSASGGTAPSAPCPSRQALRGAVYMGSVGPHTAQNRMRGPRLRGWAAFLHNQVLVNQACACWFRHHAVAHPGLSVTKHECYLHREPRNLCDWFTAHLFYCRVWERTHSISEMYLYLKVLRK